MVECQWDSVGLSPYFPVLTGLELTFMGMIGSNSGLSELQVLLSYLWENEKEKKMEREGKEKE